MKQHMVVLANLGSINETIGDYERAGWEMKWVMDDGAGTGWYLLIFWRDAPAGGNPGSGEGVTPVAGSWVRVPTQAVGSGGPVAPSYGEPAPTYLTGADSGAGGLDADSALTDAAVGGAGFYVGFGEGGSVHIFPTAGYGEGDI